MKFTNYYYCRECKNSWDSEWDCMCNEKCDICGAEIEPEKSVDNIKKVRITKIQSVSEYSVASEICDGYWVEGILLAPIEIGEPIILIRDRNIKNGSNIKYGFFQTSSVVEIREFSFTTRNSEYKIEYLDE